MAGGGDRSQKTEKPTPRRLKEARERGQIARSPEIVAWTTLLIGALLIQLVRYTLLANGVPDAAALVVKGAIIAGAVWSQQRARAE